MDQRISKSVHEGSLVILAHDKDFTSANISDGRTSLGNGNFLVMGHNGGSVAFENSFDNDENTLMNRIWAFDETGTVGDVYVAIPFSDLNIPGNNLYAVLSTDQVFDRSDTFAKMTNDHSYWSAKINPSDGEFMTFMSTDTDTDFTLDLYIKDSPDDIGEEPNMITGEKNMAKP